MKFLIVYVAVAGGSKTHEYCARFVGSYLACPPGAACEIVVACNGGMLATETALLFEPLAPQFMVRAYDNGWDITAYMDAAKRFECDAMLCCGETIYFHREGWLRRFEDAWNRNGPGMYGMFASFLVRAHINTTGFLVSPAALLSYPRPQNRNERYAFEHGEHALWRRLERQGKPVRLVTWDGVWTPYQWRLPRNILWRGDQSNCLAYCSHTDRWRAAPPETKKKWSAMADQPFK